MVNHLKLLHSAGPDRSIPADATDATTGPAVKPHAGPTTAELIEYLHEQRAAAPIALRPAVSLYELILPLLASADAAQLRRVAESLDREADNLRMRARDLERAAVERSRRRQRQADRAAALDAVRAAVRDGTPAAVAATAVAAVADLDPAALLAMHRADARRWSAAERLARDRAIMAMAGSRSDAEIADMVGLSARRVGEIIAAGKVGRRRHAPIDTARRLGAL